MYERPRTTLTSRQRQRRQKRKLKTLAVLWVCWLSLIAGALAWLLASGAIQSLLDS